MSLPVVQSNFILLSVFVRRADKIYWISYLHASAGEVGAHTSNKNSTVRFSTQSTHKQYSKTIHLSYVLLYTPAAAIDPKSRPPNSPDIRNKLIVFMILTSWISFYFEFLISNWSKQQKTF